MIEAANRCRPGVCPTVYHYRIEPDLVYTLESYITGKPLPLADLSASAASALGVSLGAFFRALHARAAPLPGSGLLTWGEYGVCTALPYTWVELWHSRTVEVEQQVDTLAGASLGVSGADLQRQATEALIGLREEPTALALVNRDITPENLLAHGERWVGLVDPVPPARQRYILCGALSPLLSRVLAYYEPRAAVCSAPFPRADRHAGGNRRWV